MSDFDEIPDLADYEYEVYCSPTVWAQCVEPPIEHRRHTPDDAQHVLIFALRKALGKQWKNSLDDRESIRFKARVGKKDPRPNRGMILLVGVGGQDDAGNTTITIKFPNEQ